MNIISGYIPTTLGASRTIAMHSLEKVITGGFLAMARAKFKLQTVLENTYNICIA